MSLGLGIVAVLVIGGGLLWCHLVPRESDRFAHSVYLWITMIVLAIGLNVAAYFFPGLS